MTLNKIQALLDLLLAENEFLKDLIERSPDDKAFKQEIRTWVMGYASPRPHLSECCNTEKQAGNQAPKMFFTRFPEQVPTYSKYFCVHDYYPVSRLSQRT